MWAFFVHPFSHLRRVDSYLRPRTYSFKAPSSDIVMDGRQEDGARSPSSIPDSSQSPPSSLAGTPLKTLQTLESNLKPSSRGTATTKIRRRNRPNHIPRPRNPFMIYRTEFYRSKKSSLGFEKDHRHISRIIAYCWNNLSDAEKRPWHEKAAAEKAAHSQKYPDYQYMPLQRTEPIKKRKVKRNGESDIKRCQAVAWLLKQGKEGKELASAIKQLDIKTLPKADECVIPEAAPFPEPCALPFLSVEASIFCSPLIPTIESLSLKTPSAHTQRLPSSLPSSDATASGLPLSDILSSEAYIFPYPYDGSGCASNLLLPIPDCTIAFPLSGTHYEYPARNLYDGLSSSDYMPSFVAPHRAPDVDVVHCPAAFPDASVLYGEGTSSGCVEPCHDNRLAYFPGLSISSSVDHAFG